MPRTWLSLSIPLLRGLRIGRSWSDTEPRPRAPRLPSWKKFELRRGLKGVAAAHGETMTEDEAGYLVDRAADTPGGVDVIEDEIEAGGATREDNPPP